MTDAILLIDNTIITIVVAVTITIVIITTTTTTTVSHITDLVTEVLLYVYRNQKLIRDGEPGTATSTFTQLLSSGRQ